MHILELNNVCFSFGKRNRFCMQWTEFDPENDLPEITEETPLLGQACTYKLEIIGGKQFSRGVKGAYCQYKFNGATYQTDRIQLTEKEEKNGTNNPMFNFMKIHHVESVDQQFLDSLNSGLEVQIFIVVPTAKLSIAR